jgi:hypothetical protein
MPKETTPTPDFNDLVCSGKEYAKTTPPFNHIVKENAEMRHRETAPAKPAK